MMTQNRTQETIYCPRSDQIDSATDLAGYAPDPKFQPPGLFNVCAFLLDDETSYTTFTFDKPVFKYAKASDSSLKFSSLRGEALLFESNYTAKAIVAK
jgi:hypothetical protein